MKIHIVGCSGSGKTYLAALLSKKYSIPHYDLDNLFWDNSANKYGLKTPENKRSEMLTGILLKKDWIIEGVYYTWVAQSFAQADIIIVLDVPPKTYKTHIIQRFCKRKLMIEQGKKETLKTLVALLQWTDRFQKINLPAIYSAISNYQDKTVVLRSAKEIDHYAK